MMKSRELPLVMKGAWPCPALQCEAPDPATRGRWIEQFMRTAYAHGLSLYTVCYVNFSHQDRDLDETLQRLERVCGDLQRVRDDRGGGT
jgi:glutamate-1-semialdehyde 2,1-aminomutase